MKGIIIFLIAWFALGTFNFGTINSELAYVSTHEFRSLHQSQRDNLGILVFESYVFAPVELFTTAFISNFWQHGWDLTNKPWEESE